MLYLIPLLVIARVVRANVKLYPGGAQLRVCKHNM